MLKRILLGLGLALLPLAALAGVGGTHVVCDSGCQGGAVTFAAVAGTQRGVTISSATALTVPAGATAAFVSVQGTNNTSGICAYWQDDGTAPTASAGQPAASLWSAWYNIKSLPITFIAATGATCTLNASYYK